MARSITPTYKPVAVDRSFVAGTEDVLAHSGADDPHGGGDIASAVRRMYAEENAVPVVPQYWKSTEWFGTSSATPSANADRTWLFRVDGAFTDYEVVVYYEANVAVGAAFKFSIAQKQAGADILVDTLDLPSVNAGGADRRVRKTWTVNNLQTYEEQVLKLELRTVGDGSTANRVKGVYVRPLELSGAIAAQQGGHYSGSFPTPDADVWGADRPLSADKIDDLKKCLLSLQSNRRKPYLVYARSSASFAQANMSVFLTTLFPAHESASAQTAHALVSSVSADKIYSSQGGHSRVSSFLGAVLSETIVGTAPEFTFNAGALPIVGPGYSTTDLIHPQEQCKLELSGEGWSKGFGEFSYASTDFGALVSVLIEGE